MSVQLGLKNAVVPVYNVDIVMCIDATGSMQPHLDRVLSEARALSDQIRVGMEKLRNAKIPQLRVKVIFFRDWIEDDRDQLIESSFFTLPTDAESLRSFLSTQVAEGGGAQINESGLEALSVAIQSKWHNSGARNDRHIIVMWTDDGAYRLEDMRSRSMPANYPKDKVAKSLSELQDWWNNRMQTHARRLLLFAPGQSPWPEIGGQWENVEFHQGAAGSGMQAEQWGSFIKSLCASIAQK